MTHNLNFFRSKLSFGTKLVAMVKAGSYGAGDFEVAQLLQHQGVDYLAVAFADEGVLLRERGISMPVVVLNADADSFDQMIANRLEPEIYSLHSLRAFAGAVVHAGEAVTRSISSSTRVCTGWASWTTKSGRCARRWRKPRRSRSLRSSRTSTVPTCPKRMPIPGRRSRCSTA